MKTSLILSGGGSKGSFEVGVVQQLEEIGVTFDHIAGVSVGALNGLLIAQGKTDELAKEWNGIKGPSDVFDNSFLALIGHWMNFSPSSILKPGKLLRKMKSYADLHRCKSELRVGVTDLNTHEFVVVDQNNSHLGDYVIASLSLPNLLPPVKIGNKAYMDGGVINDYPIKEAIKFGSDVIHLVLTKPMSLPCVKLATVKNSNKLKIFMYAPQSDLGSILDFNPKSIHQNIALGRAMAKTVYQH